MSIPSDPETVGQVSEGSTREFRRPLAMRITGTGLGLLAIVGMGVLAALVLEIVNVRALGVHDIAADLERLSAESYLLSALVFVSLGLAVYAITHSFVGALVTVAGIGAILGFAHYEKMLLRREPLFPADIVFLQEPGFLFEAIGARSALMFAAGAAAIVSCAALWIWLRRYVSVDSGWRNPLITRRNLPLRILSGGVAVAVVASVFQFHSDQNRFREAYEAVGARWVPWSQMGNFRTNGFTAAYLYNLPGPAMETPAGYSRAAVLEVLDRWEAEAARTNASRTADPLAVANVIVILGESFADPLLWDGMEFSEDPILFTRELMESTPSGTMLSSGYGGGTANIEWEVLTGFSIREFAPQMRSPYQRLIPFSRSYPSQFDRIRALQPRESIGIHPFLASFYQRSTVYPALGFDRSYFIDSFDNERIDNSRYISDEAAFTKAVRELRGSSSPLSISLLTMQNHSPYGGNYSDPIWPSGPFPEDSLREAAHYARGLAHSDAAMQTFLESLEQLDEPTLVLFYGDHLPNIVPSAVWEGLPEQARYETPFFIWSTENLNEPELPAIVGPNHLMSIAFESLGAPQSPLDALLAELRQTAPARSPQFTLDAAGRSVADADVPPSTQELLADYVMLQYDIAVGGRYSIDRLYAPVMPER